MVESNLYSKSQSLFDRATRSIPGGVNSPVRAFKSVGGTPLFFNKASGAYLFDEDGRKYIDYINSWGPMILGHGHPEVVAAVRDQLGKAMTFGAPTELEIEVAELICAMAPNVERVRMVNSGTEACMSAIRLARGYTGRDKFVKFAGCYHGHSDSFLIKAGSGALTFGTPSSPGVTPGTAADTLIAEYNDLASVEKLFSDYPDQIAAIIIEPVAGNMGCIPPHDGFLQSLRAICDTHDSLLIFDEVMTGFRLAPGGAQELYAVQADIVTYGKVIGGGMPVGAFGGRAEIFDHLSPVGPVYQAGTLSGNPVAMRCGQATLSILHKNPEIYQSIDNYTALLHEGLDQILASKGMPAQINRLGSMISLHFSETKVTDYSSATAGDNDHFKKFFHGMLAAGVYLPPSAYESWFIGNALGDDELDRTLTLAERVISSL